MSGKLNPNKAGAEYVWSGPPTYDDKGNKTGYVDRVGYIGDRPMKQDSTTGKITFTDGKPP